MKKLVLGFLLALSLVLVGQPTQAATINTYSGMVFKDDVNADQFNELSRTSYLAAVRAKKFEGKIIAYTHIKLPNDKYYSRTVYLAEIRKQGNFLSAIQSLAATGRAAANLNIVRGKVTDEGKVVPAEEPQVREFKVIDIK